MRLGPILSGRVVKGIVRGEEAGEWSEIGGGGGSFGDESVGEGFGVAVDEGDAGFAGMAKSLRAGRAIIEGRIAGIGQRGAHEFVGSGSVLSITEEGAV